MDIHTATEQAYKNGYEQGRKDAIEQVITKLKGQSNLGDSMVETPTIQSYQTDSDMVSISKEEYDDLVESKRQLGCYIEDQQIWIDAANGASKETAKKILREILFIDGVPGWQNNSQLVEFGNKVVDKLEELAKEFGVELLGVKNER